MVARRDLEARQLGGMDEMKMLTRSWSASSKNGFQSDLPSLIARDKMLSGHQLQGEEGKF